LLLFDQNKILDRQWDWICGLERIDPAADKSRLTAGGDLRLNEQHILEQR
jgi:hypothetical protein